MKKCLLILSFLWAGCTAAWAQIPNGSTAPNFTVVDIYGVPHNLYNLLDQGKTVYLDVFATWCGPCWNYHQTHALADLWDMYGPSGTNEAYVIAIEGDASTSVPCITNSPGCTGGTIGDWSAGTPYPIADYPAIMSLYQVNYYPTIFMICPADKKVYEVGQQGTSGLWAARTANCPALTVTTTVNAVQNVRCFGTNTGSIDISVSGGLPPYTYSWSNGATTQDLNNLPAGTYTCTITNSQGWVGVSDPIDVEGPSDPLSLSLQEITPVGCNGILGSITLEASGGWSSNYNYSWSNGQTGNTALNLNPGSYICTVTDDNGCTKTLTTAMAPAAIPVASIATPGTISCTTPEIQLSASATGGWSGTFNYLWYATNGGNITEGANSATPTINATGSYTVQVSDAETTCSGFATITVSGNTTPPTANAGPAMSVTCASPTTVLQGTGSSGNNITYQWTASNGGHIASGANSLTPTVDAAGTYTLVVTNTANGCTQSSATAVTGNNTAPTASATGGALTCTSSSVSLASTTNAGNPGFAWTGPNGFASTTQNPTVNAEGAYLLTVTDSITGCTNTATAMVSTNTTAPGAAATGGVLTCTNTAVGLNGSSTATGATFQWAGPNGFTSNVANPSVSETGTYSLVTTDPANGCTSETMATVTQNTTAPTASATVPGNLNCNTTQLEINGSGSSQGAAFSYAWTTANGNIVSGATSASPVVDAAGTYDLVVTDAGNGCTAATSVSVNQSTTVTAAISNSGNVSCNGGTNGSATVLAGGGNASYSYAWSNGATGESAANLAAGTYTVIVTDGENCTASASVVITQPAVLAVNATVTAQTANGVNDGTATANPSGGTSGYSYTWSNGENTAAITGLAPGTYTVTVVDANACTSVQSVTVNSYNCTMAAAVSSANISCFGANNGSAEVNLMGANDPVNYLWSNGASSASVANLAAGTYTVEVVDATNCASVLEVTISEPSAVGANASATNETALGANDGTATAAPTGGTGAYSYAWSNGETTQTVTNLAPGTYTVVVTDANSCTNAQTVVVNAFNCTVAAQATVVNVSCAGQNNGAVTLSVSSGAEPYTYAWSNGATTSSIENIAPGTYTASITDANGCETVTGGTVTEPQPLEITGTTNNPACVSDPSGSIVTSVSGGTGTYSYAWNTGASTSSLADLAPGTYTLTLTDGNGCVSTADYTLMAEDNTAPEITAPNATLAINANGGASATLQSLNASVTDNCTVTDVTITPNAFDCSTLGEHTVTITATDDAGNTASKTLVVTVVDNTAPTVTCPANITRCWFDNTVSYDAPVAQDNCLTNGGAWNLEEGLPSGSTFPTGETVQTYTFTDASGNAGSCSFRVNITTPIDLAVASVSNDVNNQGLGSIDITVSGGDQPYGFVWTNESGAVVGTTEDLSGLFAGIYQVEIKDANGCTISHEGIVVDNTTGTSEPGWMSGVTMRPNPTSSITHIVFGQAPATQLEISVVDATGRVLLTQITDQQPDIRLDCSKLPEGVYVVRFRTGNEVGVRKLMIGR